MWYYASFSVSMTLDAVWRQDVWAHMCMRYICTKVNAFYTCIYTNTHTYIYICVCMWAVQLIDRWKHVYVIYMYTYMHTCVHVMTSKCVWRHNQVKWHLNSFILCLSPMCLHSVYHSHTDNSIRQSPHLIRFYKFLLLISLLQLQGQINLAWEIDWFHLGGNNTLYFTGN